MEFLWGIGNMVGSMVGGFLIEVGGSAGAGFSSGTISLLNVLTESRMESTGLDTLDRWHLKVRLFCAINWSRLPQSSIHCCNRRREKEKKDLWWQLKAQPRVLPSEILISHDLDTENHWLTTHTFPRAPDARGPSALRKSRFESCLRCVGSADQMNEKIISALRLPVLGIPVPLLRTRSHYDSTDSNDHPKWTTSTL